MLNENGRVKVLTKAERRKLIEEKTGIKTRKTRGKTTFPSELLASLFNEEFDNFKAALRDVREIDPRSYIKAVIDIGKMIAPNKKEVDVKHKIDVDLHELAMLSQIPQPKALADTNIEFTDFDEIPAEAQYDEDSEEEIAYNTHPAIKEDFRELGLAMTPIPRKTNNDEQ